MHINPSLGLYLKNCSPVSFAAVLNWSLVLASIFAGELQVYGNPYVSINVSNFSRSPYPKHNLYFNNPLKHKPLVFCCLQSLYLYSSRHSKSTLQMVVFTKMLERKMLPFNYLSILCPFYNQGLGFL